MTITTYSELKTQVADFLNRDDLTSQIPVFIQLAEASINRRLRHWRMEKRSTASLTTQFTELPTDWIESVSVGESAGEPFAFIDRAAMMKKRDDNDSAGTPCYYTITGGELEVYPVPSSALTVELVYYAEVPALSDSNTSNWLLSKAPDAYLYGSLLHTAPYLQEDPRVQIWGGLYRDIIDGLNGQSLASRGAGSGLARRVR